MRRQEGQIIPALVMVMLSLIAVGMLFFQVGRAAIFSTEAQTAADAAALAAAKNVQAQLTGQVWRSNTSDLGLIDDAQVRAEAERYASKNGAHVVRLERNGVDVRVWVSTKKTLGDGAKALGKEDTRGEARARARLELQVIPGSGSLGPAVSGGDPTIPDKEWDRLKKQIRTPPSCDDARNDLVPLGKLLRSHGFAVGENADLGDNPAPGVHSATGYHYRCHNSAAIDLNHDQGDEGGTLDALVEPLHRLGFRTLWRTTGHFDHMHIDVAASPSIGAGFGPGGAVGGLEETMLDVRLIDWNSAELPFGGLGGGGGGGVFWGAAGGGPAGLAGAGSSAARRTRPWRARSARCSIGLTRRRRCSWPRSRRRSWSRACTTSATATATPWARSSSGRARAGGRRRRSSIRCTRRRSSSRVRSGRTAPRARGSSPRTCRSRRSRIATTASRCRPRGCCRGSADEAGAGVRARFGGLRRRFVGGASGGDADDRHVAVRPPPSGGARDASA